MKPAEANHVLQIQAVTNPNIPSIYVEGVSQMMIGFPNSRMMFHNFSQKDPSKPDGPEMRTMACELIIPTAALIEMARGILHTLTENKAALESTKNEWLEKINVLTDSL